jgi:hypothetical protein
MGHKAGDQGEKAPGAEARMSVGCSWAQMGRRGTDEGGSYGDSLPAGHQASKERMPKRDCERPSASFVSNSHNVGSESAVSSLPAGFA